MIGQLAHLAELSAPAALSAIHAGEGSIVSFWKKDSSGKLCVNLGGIESPAVGILELFQGQPDIYFTVNSTYEQKGNRYSDETSLKLYSRRERCLKYINAICLDLDQHTGAFSFPDAFQTLLDEAESQGAPWPSLVCASGRGLWALWLLHDRLNADQPPTAHPDVRIIAKRVGRAVARAFAHLGADLKIHDGSRLMRLPESINSSAQPDNQRVSFYRLTGKRHSLPELGAAFHVKTCKTALRSESDGPKSERHVLAGRRRWSAPLAAIRQLEKMRGGFRAGTRRASLWSRAVLMRKNRATEEQICRELAEAASRCVPPCNEGDIQDALTASRNVKGHVSNTAFADCLKVTREEKMALWALCSWFKECRKTKGQEIRDRRAIIARELAAQPGLSIRDLAAVLRDSYSIKAARATVARDRLAIAEAQAHRRKPAQRQEWAAFAPAMAGQEQGGQGAMYV